MADLLVLPRPAKKFQIGAGFGKKSTTYWAGRKGKSGLSTTEREQLARTPESPLPKEKGTEPFVQITRS